MDYKITLNLTAGSWDASKEILYFYLYHPKDNNEEVLCCPDLIFFSSKTKKFLSADLRNR